MKCLSRVVMSVIALSAVMVSCNLTDIECPAVDGMDKKSCDGACVDLRTDNENCGECGNRCKDGEKCKSGACRISCPEGQIICGSACADLTNDINHCGECGHACKDGEKCDAGECVISCGSGQIECDGSCVDTQTDSKHCGGCGQRCSESQQCVEGACTCPEGTTDCNSQCFDFEKLNLDNCTECKQGYCDPNGDKSLGCKSIEDLNVTACTSTYVTCDSTHLDCDQKRSNGCETEIGNDNCGECGYICESGRICKNGSCEVTCAENETNCDGRCLNLSELHRSECNVCADGYCDTGSLACSPMSLLRVNSCSGDTIECHENYLNCDGDIKNGCETSKNDNENCGACNHKCSNGKVCSNGTCATTCGNGLEICGDSCVDLKEFHLKNCSTCEENYCDSDGNMSSNGCEVNAKGSDVNNCGGCGMKCNVANADNYCNDGVCKFHCREGYHEYENTCEIDSVEHCGNHGTKCEIAYSENLRCEAGKCEFDCVAGSHRFGSSCEQDSVDTCGNHTTKCSIDNGTPKCENGKCVYNCNTGYHLYEDTCEADTASHCGNHYTICPNVANATAKCENKKCDFTCVSGYHKYNGGCEIDSTSNCGAHGTKCTSAPSNGSPKCSNGTCTFSCDLGYFKSGQLCVSMNMVFDFCKPGTFYCASKGCCSKENCQGTCFMISDQLEPLPLQP